MTWTPNYVKGVTPTVWDQLAPFPVASYHGASCVYDGSRYIYFIVQVGVTTTAAGTTQLWQYDTQADGWALLGTAVSGNQGMDLEYDAVRNVLHVMIGAALTTWQVFNLNTVAVTVANVSCAARAFTTMTPVLPAASGLGASLSLPDDLSLNGSTTTLNGSTPLDSGTADATSTATVIVADASSSTFGSGMNFMYVRFLTGPLAGQRRMITSATGTALTVNAFTGAPVAGDQFVVEIPELQASGTNSTTAVQVTGAGWTTNAFRDMDIVFISGSLAGQRRRIASNDATTLTLATAVTGNPRTGPLGGTPGTSDWFRIVPSSDFLYYATGTALYRLDLVQTTGVAWSASLATTPGATGGGSNLIYPRKYDPFGLMLFRGGANNNVYHFDIGTRTWTSQVAFFPGETFTTGASVAGLHGHRRIFFQKEGTTRTYFLNVSTGIFEAGPTVPYAAPGAYEGKRAKLVITPDGVEFLYFHRAGSQEFYRVPLDWLQVVT